MCLGALNTYDARSVHNLIRDTNMYLNNILTQFMCNRVSWLGYSLVRRPSILACLSLVESRPVALPCGQMGHNKMQQQRRPLSDSSA